MQRVVKERDAAFADLLRRMVELERRLPEVTPPEQAPAPAQATPPPPAPEEPEPAAPPGDAEDAIASQEAAPSVPGQVQVNEEAVASALERALVQEGTLLLPPGTVQVQPRFIFARQEPTRLNFQVQDGQQLVSVSQERQDSFSTGLTLLAGLPSDSQLALDFPYRYEEADTLTQEGVAGVGRERRHAAGFGDISVGLSKGLLREQGWRPDLVARVSWDTDTGRTDGGLRLGSGFNEVTADVTASKSQDPLVFVAGLSYSHAFEDDGVQPGYDVGLALGAVLAASPETSLRFFLDQNFVGATEVDGVEVPGSDRTVGLFSVGLSMLLTPRALLDVELGIGLTTGAPDYTIGVSLPVRFNLPVRF